MTVKRISIEVEAKDYRFVLKLLKLLPFVQIISGAGQPSAATPTKKEPKN